jgi:hypothetical protein
VEKSFAAVLGSDKGPVFGGGIEIVAKNVFQSTGGAEFRLTRWLGAAAEAERSRVPNALGQGRQQRRQGI